ncbi:MAG: TerC family protein [Pedosphaera sp.]|nr:TerC family protein [Pedosphaera sp.]
MDWITSPEAWISLLTLTVLEIVLGIDNIVFISILANKLPPQQQEKARKIGLLLALGTRILLLMSIAWISRLTTPWFHVAGHGVSGRDLILLIGGLFLLAKSTHEIHEKLEGEDGGATKKLSPTFLSVLIQIMILDIVFSLDSVVTAVGMAKHVSVMICAVCISVMFMLVFSGYISRFVERHPTIKMLALSFLLLIGCSLVAEAFHQEIPKGYIYFAMAFSIGVEMINLRLRKKAPPVELHQPYR